MVNRQRIQQSVAICLGGHFTLPKLQKTQQSPELGFSRAPQPGQFQKNRQASVGIVSMVARLQRGQVNTLCTVGTTLTLFLPSQDIPPQ